MWGVLFSIAQAVAAAPESPPQLAVSGNERARLHWVRTISSPNDDWINDLMLLRNGNVAAAGFLNRRDDPPSDWSAVLAEVTPGGALVRQTNYGEGRGTDAFFGISEGPDGSRVLAGFTTRIGHGGIDAWALIERADGNVGHEEAHGGPGYDRFTDVAAAADGWVFLGHSQAEHSDKRRIFLVKTDKAGRKLWERMHDAAESWGALYIEPASGGGFIVAGGTSASGNADMFAMKVAEDGSELWRKRVGTADWNEINHGLVVRPDGEIVLVGYTNKGGGPNDVVAATLNSGGDVIRLERWGGGRDDRAILARAGADGRVWIVGHTASAGAGGDDAFVTSLGKDGSFEGAAAIIGAAADDRGTAILPFADGSLVIAGYSRSLGQSGEDAFVARLSAPTDEAHPSFRREVVQAP
ncbi:MAG TPA: hypothetical protein VFR52_04160 [Sphingomicrobium sp.]|nr:hypothetical protein [Sphingomicrobium sp.]